MRSLVLFALVAACSSQEQEPADDAAVQMNGASCATDSPCPPNQSFCDVPEGSGLVNHCACVMLGSELRWFCSDCPFYETDEPVACSTPGVGCTIETWEHDCACQCTNDGWWSCTPGTIGSHCPKHP